jgi:hypothetical protein
MRKALEQAKVAQQAACPGSRVEGLEDPREVLGVVHESID